MLFQKRGNPNDRADADLAIFRRGSGSEETRIATARWLRGESLEAEATDPATEFFYSTNLRPERRDTGTVYLGTSRLKDGEPLGWCDDRHMITVAGSRAGKGVSAIVPNLLLYKGSVVCIDPKGENARLTAKHRADSMGQDVFILDPYRTAGDELEALDATFDPLGRLQTNHPEIIEQINLVADSIVIPTPGGRDAHWDELSRAFVAAVIAHVLTVSTLTMPRNLCSVRRLLREGDVDQALLLREASEESVVVEDSSGEKRQETRRIDYSGFDALLLSMRDNTAFEGLISGFAQRLMDMSFEERGTVLSATDRHTRFIDGASMARVLISAKAGRKNLNLSKLKRGTKPVTIYLCLPSRYLSTHARWLRLMVNAIFSSLETEPGKLPIDGRMVLAILDEFPALGYMRTIETAVGYMAGFGLRIWAILQDLSQLKRDYPNSWETFLGNTGMQQFFGNVDHTTLEYISKSLGETEVTRQIRSESDISKADRGAKRKIGDRDMLDTSGNTRTSQSSESVIKVALMTQDELRVLFSREHRRQVLFGAGFNPVVAYRSLYFEMQTDGTLADLVKRT